MGGPDFLIGRDAELGRLTEVLERVIGGSREIVFLEGEPGIGKTFLLEALLARARGRGARTLSGTADAMGGSRPFGVLAEALAAPAGDGLLAPDAGGAGDGLPVGAGGGLPVPAGRPAEKGLRGLQVIEGLLAGLERLAAEGPVVLALEDLHWADQETLRAFDAVVRHLGSLPLLLVGTFRARPRSAELAALLDRVTSRGAEVLRVERLGEEAIGALCERVLGAPPSRALRRRLAAAGGNPLFAVQLLRGLQEQGAVVVGDGVADGGDGPLPPSLRQVIVRRFGQLPAATVELLQVASVLGTSFAPGDLAAVLGRPLAGLLPQLNDAVSHGLVGDRGDVLAFRHPMMRDALYESLPSAIRRRLHHEAGEALAAAGAPAAQVAVQLAEGAQPGDPEAIAWLRKAAEEVSAYSVGTAVRLLERGLELASGDGARGAAVRADLVPLLGLEGRFAEARELAAAIPAGCLSVEDEIRLRSGQARALSRQGRWAEAARAFGGIAELVPGGAVRALFEARAAYALIYAGDVAGGRARAERIRDAASGPEYEQALGAAVTTLALALAAEGELKEALDLGERGLAAVGDSRPAPGAFLFPHIPVGFVLLDADRPDDAERVLNEGHALMEEVGALSFRPYVPGVKALRGFHFGDWETALSEAESGLVMDEEIGTRWLFFAETVIGRIALARDDLRTAGRMAAETEAALAAADAPEFATGRGWSLWIGALLLEAGGEAGAAARAAARAWRALDGCRMLGNRLPALDAVRLAAAAGDGRVADAVTGEVAEYAEHAGTSTAEGLRLHCMGLASGDTDALVASVEAYREGSRGFEHGLAAESAAVALARDGRAADARRMLAEALERYEPLGARREAARATAALRALGVRPGARRRRADRPAHGWQALTPTERNIAALIAEGLTNPQIAERVFISRYTVETHLKRVFAKMRVRSRAELAALVVARTPHRD
ncbi:ATP-binding protein [Actinomadura fibrosa]|uniref:ATP-binding protein n=3 Tax=Actinomadura fibrosa TaxID=111802 RepID=A0ABW2XT44_9ACTN